MGIGIDTLVDVHREPAGGAGGTPDVVGGTGVQVGEVYHNYIRAEFGECFSEGFQPEVGISDMEKSHSLGEDAPLTVSIRVGGHNRHGLNIGVESGRGGQQVWVAAVVFPGAGHVEHGVHDDSSVEVDFVEIGEAVSKTRSVGMAGQFDEFGLAGVPTEFAKDVGDILDAVIGEDIDVLRFAWSFDDRGAYFYASMQIMVNGKDTYAHNCSRIVDKVRSGVKIVRVVAGSVPIDVNGAVVSIKKDACGVGIRMALVIPPRVIVAGQTASRASECVIGLGCQRQ